MKRSLLLAAALAACGESGVVLAPAIDTPPPGSEADPLPGLPEVELSVALAGDADALVAASFARGEPLELPGVPYADGLVVHLSGRNGDSEVAYGRTCGFDLTRGVPPPAPHLYFARTVKWAAAPPPPQPTRTGGGAFAAPDGSAVYLGGTDGAGGAALTAIDRFDPAAGAFAGVGELAGRRGALFVRLGDGRALGLGGIDEQSGDPAGYYEVVDALAAPALRVERVEEVRLRRLDFAAAALSDGSVVLIGGLDGAPGGPAVPVGTVTRIAVAAGGALEVSELDARLAVPRAGHTLTRLSDDVGAALLVVGGLDGEEQPVAEVELYKPLREAFADPTLFHPRLGVPRHHHAALRTDDGSVLVMGGLDGAGDAVAALELYSVDGGFAPAGDLPAGAGLLDAALTPLPDGRILISGGRDRPDGPPLDTAFIARVDPFDGSVDVVATDRLARPRAGHQAVLLCDGTVLLVGGAAGEPAAERYDPPSLGRR